MNCWTKFQGVLRSLRFDGIVVLVDRVDEPYLINGSTELMRALVWPMLDNKFLKHPGLGLKLLLPIELERLFDRAGPRFPPAGPAGQAEPGPLAGLDGPIACTTWPTRGSPPVRPRAARRSSPTCSTEVDEHRLNDALRHVAGAAAPVQVHVPPVHGPLQRPHRGPAGVEDFRPDLRVDLGPVSARPGRLRSRRGGGVIKRGE